MGVLGQETRRKMGELETKTGAEVERLSRELKGIVQTVEEAVVKVVNKRFDFQLKQIDRSIRENGENIRQVRIDVTNVEEEIKNMKNLLSQKANFSDIVHHVEKKADKQDFKDLNMRMNET